MKQRIIRSIALENFTVPFVSPDGFAKTNGSNERTKQKR